MRIGWIDVLKGIGIIAVVFGHRFPHGVFRMYIYSFHMPLFFFISGYLFYSTKSISFSNFIKKKFHTLLIPYFVFTGLSSLLIPVLPNLISGRPIKYFNLIQEMFYINGQVIWNTPLWFLVCLFFVEIFYFYYKDRTDRLIVISLFCSGFIGYIFSMTHVRMPFAIDIAFVGLVYYGIGFLVNKNGLIRKMQKLLPTWALSVIFIIIHAIIFTNNGEIVDKVDMYSMFYGSNYIVFYITALAGVFAYAFISQSIQDSEILSYLGRNSIVIMSTHFITFTAVFLLERVFKTNYVDTFPVVVGTLECLFALVITTPILYLLQKQVPWVLGRKSISS